MGIVGKPVLKISYNPQDKPTWQLFREAIVAESVRQPTEPARFVYGLPMQEEVDDVHDFYPIDIRRIAALAHHNDFTILVSDAAQRSKLPALRFLVLHILSYLNIHLASRLRGNEVNLASA